LEGTSEGGFRTSNIELAIAIEIANQGDDYLALR
jgi:hypothetical protein